MLDDNGGSAEQQDSVKSMAEAAWAIQSQHHRFLFNKARPDGHPSRVAWVNANNLWMAQVRARKAGHTSVSVKHWFCCRRNVRRACEAVQIYGRYQPIAPFRVRRKLVSSRTRQVPKRE